MRKQSIHISFIILLSVLLLMTVLIGCNKDQKVMNSSDENNMQNKSKSMEKSMTRAEQLKEVYKLEKHEEGGSFSEVYTAPFEKDGRALAGSIYFLLDKKELSHFHEIDCDEIWYFHEGCGLQITVLNDEGMHQYLLGSDTDKGERSMVVIPKGSVFAAENLQNDGFTFVSCATAPKFKYSGFRMIGKEELRKRFPGLAEDLMYLVDSKSE